MQTRNADWYNLNEQRCWPLSDAATQIDDRGQRLPSDILSDLVLRFPKATAAEAFLSAVTISPRLVTLIISAADDDHTPLASLSVLRPVEPGVQLPLQSEDGVSYGRVVLGSGLSRVVETSETLSYRFSLPAQSRLASRAARPFRQPEIASLGVAGDRRALTGDVWLLGGSDVESRGEVRVIEGKRKLVGVLRLKDKSEASASVLNLSETYAGDCGQRPESKNCRDGIPIEAINEVIPDCCGRIFIEFRGAEPFEITNDELNGVGVDYAFNLEDACVTPARLPDSRGRLPNEYPDLCTPVAQPLVSASSVADEPVSFTAQRVALESSSEILFGLRYDSGEWRTDLGELPYDPTQFGEISQVFGDNLRLGLTTPVPHGLAEGDVIALPYPAWCVALVQSVRDDYSFTTNLSLRDGRPSGWLRLGPQVAVVDPLLDEVALTSAAEFSQNQPVYLLSDQLYAARVLEVINAASLRLDPPVGGLVCLRAQPLTRLGLKAMELPGGPAPDAVLLLGTNGCQALHVEAIRGSRVELSGQIREGMVLWLPSTRQRLPLGMTSTGNGRLLREQPYGPFSLLVDYRLRQETGRRSQLAAVVDYVSAEDHVAVVAEFDARRIFKVIRVDRGKRLLQASVAIPRDISVGSELQLQATVATADDGQRYLLAALSAKSGDMVALRPVRLNRAASPQVGVQTRGVVSLLRFHVGE